MKRWLNRTLQLILGTAQVINVSALPVSEEAKTGIAALIAVVQALISSHAHSVNPDGTTAKLPYVEK